VTPVPVIFLSLLSVVCLGNNRVELVRIGIYCRTCFAFKRFGREAGPCGGLEWIDKCDRCLERERKKLAEVERLELMWASRLCAAPDCGVVFTPAHPKQRFHSDACRKRTHRRAKAAAKT
jgi:hypothetical protein